MFAALWNEEFPEVAGFSYFFSLMKAVYDNNLSKKFGFPTFTSRGSREFLLVLKGYSNIKNLIVQCAQYSFIN